MLNTVEATGEKCGIFTPAVAARYAVAVEEAAKQALATLNLIEAGGFFDSLSAGLEMPEAYNAAMTLLDCSHRALAKALADDIGETALMFLAQDQVPPDLKGSN